MKPTQYLSLLLLASILFACSKVPLTGRSQLSIANSQDIKDQSVKAYKDFLSSPKTKVIADSPDAKRIKDIGIRLANAITQYMKTSGYGDKYSFNYEFNLVESKEINAWCMPGGKVAVYTGILPITKDDYGLATVMGHEIGHAIAKHTDERYSHTMLVQAGGGVLGVATSGQSAASQQVLGQLYGFGGQIALLKYSRNQESEADKLGLIFMAMAGYDPNKAVEFWQRMSAASKQGGNKPPEFLSTHPSDETRIGQIQRYLPEALKYYSGK